MNNKEYKSDFGETIVFDPETYKKVFEGCMMEFFGKSKEEVESIIKKSGFFSEENYPPRDFNQMALLDNETVFDVVYGVLRELDDPAAKREGVPLDVYMEWEEGFLERNALDREYIRYVEE
jgi:hypothetical protein